MALRWQRGLACATCRSSQAARVALRAASSCPLPCAASLLPGGGDRETAAIVQEGLRYRLMRLVGGAGGGARGGARGGVMHTRLCAGVGQTAACQARYCEFSQPAMPRPAGLCLARAQVTGDQWEGSPKLKLRVLKLMVRNWAPGGQDGVGPGWGNRAGMARQGAQPQV